MGWDNPGLFFVEEHVLSFTLNIVEHELEPYGSVVRTVGDNPTFDKVRHYLNAATSDGSATLYVCSSEADVLAACQIGCYAVFVNPDAQAPAEGAALSVLDGETASIVFDALLDIARRYDEWEHAMDMMCFSGGSLQDLVDASEPFLRNNVVVLDPALKLLAYTRGVPCDDPITVELIAHGYHTEENIREFKLHKRFKSWSEDEGFVVNDTHVICKYTTIVRSFNGRSAFSLITVMMCNVIEDLDYLKDVFGMFTNRVEFYAQRDYPDDKPAGTAVDSFLKDLISGSLSDQAVLDRCSYAGIPYDGCFCMFYASPDDDSVPASRLLSDISLVVAPAKTLLVDGAVAVLCFNCSRGDRACHIHSTACPQGARSVSDRLGDMLERYDLVCGRSSKFTKLSGVPVAFKQARAAYREAVLSRARARAKKENLQDPIVVFDRCGAHYLVDQLSDEALKLLLATNAGMVLDEIARHDVETNMNNYEFLRAYLVHERRVSTVAEKLHMHRNNVGYRIGRIEQQFGIDTTDAQLRQDLLMTYRIRDAAIVRSAQ